MNRVLIFFILASSCTSSFGQDVKTILDRYFQSIGGRENIEALKSSSFSYKSFSFYPEKDTSYIEKKQLLPGNHVIESYYRNGKLIYQSIENGDSLYNFFIDPFPLKVTINTTKEPISLDPSTEILRLYKSRNLKYSKVDSLNGIEYQVLKTNYNPGYKKSNTAFYFDNQTGLLSARKTNDNVAYYKDYRKVKSISFPFVHEQYLNTLLLHKNVYEKVDFNVDLTPDDFSFTYKLEDIPPLRNPNSKFNKVEFVDSKYNNVSLNDLMNNFRGQRILIDIWATWCGPCKNEFTKYDENLYAFLAQKGIQLLFISLDRPEKENQWKKDLLWFNLNGYHIMAGNALHNSIKKEINEGNPLAIPRYILINEKGEILSNDIGKPSASDFRDKVSKLLD